MEFLNIKEQIKSKGYTYETFGNKIGLTKTSIARIVSGSQTPSFETLGKIAKILDVDVRDLFNPTKTNQNPKDEVQSIINQLENLKDKL